MRKAKTFIKTINSKNPPIRKRVSPLSRGINGDAGYSNQFEDMLRTKFEKIKLNDDQLIFKEVEWSSILSTNESKLFHNIKENLSFLGLRKFIIHSFGDAIAYQKTGSPHDTYNLINDLISAKYDDILGYPLGNITPKYQDLVKAGKLIDIEVNSGTILTSWNPLCHLDYWTDKDVIKIIAEEVR